MPKDVVSQHPLTNFILLNYSFTQCIDDLDFY